MKVRYLVAVVAFTAALMLLATNAQRVPASSVAQPIARSRYSTATRTTPAMRSSSRPRIASNIRRDSLRRDSLRRGLRSNRGWRGYSSIPSRGLYGSRRFGYGLNYRHQPRPLRSYWDSRGLGSRFGYGRFSPSFRRGTYSPWTSRGLYSPWGYRGRFGSGMYSRFGRGMYSRYGRGLYSPYRRGFYSPYRRGFYSPYRRGFYSPYRRGLYSPYRRGFYSPYRRGLYSPYRRGFYSPYRRGLYSPYRRGFYSPYRRGLYSPYRRSVARGFYPGLRSTFGGRRLHYPSLGRSYGSMMRSGSRYRLRPNLASARLGRPLRGTYRGRLARRPDVGRALRTPYGSRSIRRTPRLTTGRPLRSTQPRLMTGRSRIASQPRYSRSPRATQPIFGSAGATQPSRSSSAPVAAVPPELDTSQPRDRMAEVVAPHPTTTVTAPSGGEEPRTAPTDTSATVTNN